MPRNDLKFGSRRYAPKLKPKTGWPEVTALIDVLFIMLLFFALSGSFVRISGIRVDLPRYTAPNKADVERLVVTVSPPEVPGKPHHPAHSGGDGGPRGSGSDQRACG